MSAQHSCLIIEDEALAIEMMVDYISRRNDLKLVGIASQLSEVEAILQKATPAIIFLDLVIPVGEPTTFSYKQLPNTSVIVVVSAMPLSYFRGELPQRKLYELAKPLSFEHFDRCINKILQDKRYTSS